MEPLGQEIIGNNVDNFNSSCRYGNVVSDAKCKTGVWVVLLEPQQVIDIMLSRTRNKEQEDGGIVKFTKKGEIILAFLTYLSDLKLLPKALQVVAKWSMEKKGKLSKEICSLCSIYAPSLPYRQRICYVEDGESKYQHFSYSNDVYRFGTIVENDSVTKLCISWEKVTSSPLDGRKYEVSLKKQKMHKKQRTSATPTMKNKGICVNVVVWNCRGMSRPSFIPHLQALVEARVPSVVILTEARLKETLVRVMVGRYPYHRLVTSSDSVKEGRVAILCVTPFVDVMVTYNSDGELECLLIQRSENLALCSYS